MFSSVYVLYSEYLTKMCYSILILYANKVKNKPQLF